MDVRPDRKRQAAELVFNLITLLAMPVALLALTLTPRRHARLIWGPTPLISYKYWSNAMRAAGCESETLMWTYYPSINKREDYDRYFEDLVPRLFGPPALRKAMSPWFALLHIVRHGRVLHLPFTGGPLGRTWLWRLEAPILRWAGVRTVVTAYGADAYRYSTVIDTSLRHGLLLSYPEAARHEAQIARHVEYWNRHADVVSVGLMVDGAGRWDVATISAFVIDCKQWRAKSAYSQADGRNAPVKVMHTPNHRGFKGTEFLVAAVEALREEGLQVELVLVEKMPNDRVRELMAETDILAEQFIATGYAMSGIEGMASGAVVMSNLEHESYTRLYRRYSFLNECPVVSTTPETLKRNLRALVTQPALREALGRAGRAYAEKYHSFEAAQALFGAIAEKLSGGDVDLMGFYHPLKPGAYNHRYPVIDHPLVESRLTEGQLAIAPPLPAVE